MALAGSDLAERQELFDFIEAELKQRSRQAVSLIRKLRKASHNQRDQLLAFAGVLDQKLAAIAASFELPLHGARCVSISSKTDHFQCLLGTMEPATRSAFKQILMDDGSGR